MPIQVQKVRELSAQTTVEFAGDSAVVHYYPHRISSRMIKTIQANSQDIGLLAETLELMLAHWDVTNDDGSEYPTTAEALLDLPVAFLGAVAQACFAAVGEDGGKLSNATLPGS